METPPTEAPPYWSASWVERRRQRYQLFGRLRHLATHDRADVNPFERQLCEHCASPGPWTMPGPPVNRVRIGSVPSRRGLRIIRTAGPSVATQLRALCVKLALASDDKILYAFHELTKATGD